MDESKSWLSSKGVWGGIVAILSAILGIWGYSISPSDQTTIADNVVAIVSAVMGAAGGVVAIYGRIRASKVIK